MKFRDRTLGLAAAGVAGLAALAIANRVAARHAEQTHPPKGRFIEVDGVRLHYTDRGTGSPVVLIHGNAVSGDDYDTSGVSELLLRSHRVIVFDRPGFGHSERPRDRIWTASQQADLLHAALLRLQVERPVVVGHSWGAIVALALATRHEADVAGLVLLSGYYFWTLRPDVPLVGLGAVPVLGDILRNTVSPLLGWLMMPLFKRAIFAPAPVPARFQAEYSPAMTLRPSEIRAMVMDGTLMIPGALSLRKEYEDLDMPVIIIAGAGDKVVFKRRARQLQRHIRGSILHVVEGAGHMVHYAAPHMVADAVEQVGQTAGPGLPFQLPEGA